MEIEVGESLNKNKKKRKFWPLSFSKMAINKHLIVSKLQKIFGMVMRALLFVLLSSHTIFIKYLTERATCNSSICCTSGLFLSPTKNDERGRALPFVFVFVFVAALFFPINLQPMRRRHHFF